MLLLLISTFWKHSSFHRCPQPPVNKGVTEENYYRSQDYENYFKALTATSKRWEATSRVVFSQLGFYQLVAHMPTLHHQMFHISLVLCCFRKCAKMRTFESERVKISPVGIVVLSADSISLCSQLRWRYVCSCITIKHAAWSKTQTRATYMRGWQCNDWSCSGHMFGSINLHTIISTKYII